MRGRRKKKDSITRHTSFSETLTLSNTLSFSLYFFIFLTKLADPSELFISFIHSPFFKFSNVAYLFLHFSHNRPSHPHLIAWKWKKQNPFFVIWSYYSIIATDFCASSSSFMGSLFRVAFMCFALGFLFCHNLIGVVNAGKFKYFRHLFFFK